MKQVSKVGIIYNDHLLMGVRQDNGKWTEPGGHLKPGENPVSGALREVKEETGVKLKPEDLKHLGTKIVQSKDQGKPIAVHAYEALLKKEPDVDIDQDPDDEVFGWDWIPIKNNSLPTSVTKNMHVPAEKNVLHFFKGFEKKAYEKRAFFKKVLKSKELQKFVGDIPNQAAQTYSGKAKDDSKKK